MDAREMTAAIQRVRELHRPDLDGGMGWIALGEYGRIAGPVCPSCGKSGEYAVRWPCPTIRALDATDSLDQQPGQTGVQVQTHTELGFVVPDGYADSGVRKLDKHLEAARMGNDVNINGTLFPLVRRTVTTYATDWTEVSPDSDTNHDLRWTPHAVGELLRRLNQEGREQADVILYAAEHGGIITSAEVRDISDLDPDQTLNDFTRAVLKITRDLQIEGHLATGVEPALLPNCEGGAVPVEFEIPLEIVEILSTEQDPDANTKFYTLIVDGVPMHAHRDKAEIHARYNRAVQDGFDCELWVSDGKAALDRLWTHPDEFPSSRAHTRGSERLAYHCSRRKPRSD